MAKPRWSRTEAADHRAKLVADAQDVLAAEVKALRSGEDWKRFLEFQSRLHAYSPNNVMLVYAQHAKAFKDGEVSEPSPGYVAGFNTWKALGRSVVKGQHGYLVLAPLRGVSVVAVSEARTARASCGGWRRGRHPPRASRSRPARHCGGSRSSVSSPSIRQPASRCPPPLR